MKLSTTWEYEAWRSSTHNTSTRNGENWIQKIRKLERTRGRKIMGEKDDKEGEKKDYHREGERW